MVNQSPTAKVQYRYLKAIRGIQAPLNVYEDADDGMYVSTYSSCVPLRYLCRHPSFDAVSVDVPSLSH